MKSTAKSLLYKGPYDEAAVKAVGEEILKSLGGTSSLAFAFVTSDYIPHLEDFTEVLRLHGHIPDIVGASARGVIHNDTEYESGSGFAILSLRLEDVQNTVIPFDKNTFENADSAHFTDALGAVKPKVWISLLNPVELNVEEWIHTWNHLFPEIPSTGGLASGGRDAESYAVFHNDRILSGGVVVGLSGEIAFDIVVSQGCRPIGNPLPVTKSEANIIYSLGAKPAYKELEAAYQTLNDQEKSHAKGNLFAGLAGNEYVDEFRPGDFLVRNIIGADPETGAVVINGVPRVGQTLQYQFRDKVIADLDFQNSIKTQITPSKQQIAALLFTCTGRGKEFFGIPNHDAEALSQALGPLPTGGFFCSGEIGPVSGNNCIHGYTASAIVLREHAPSQK